MTRKSGHNIITVVDDHGFQTVLERTCIGRDYKSSLLLHISSLKVYRSILKNFFFVWQNFFKI